MLCSGHFCGHCYAISSCSDTYGRIGDLFSNGHAYFLRFLAFFFSLRSYLNHNGLLNCFRAVSLSATVWALPFKDMSGRAGEVVKYAWQQFCISFLLVQLISKHQERNADILKNELQQNLLLA